MTAEAVNDHLKALGHGPLDVSPKTEATRQLQALKADPAWRARFESGDREATEQFNRLTLQMATGAASAEKTLRPDEYSLTHHAHLNGAPAKDVEAWNTEFRTFASQLGLSKSEASQIAQIHLDGVVRWNRMLPDQQEQFGHEQTVMLHGVLAKNGDAEAQIKAATNTLKLATGQDVDVARICRQVGAEQALELVIAAQRIARRG